MYSKTKDSKPFPLEKSLRDLALLRASEVDITSFLPAAGAPNGAISRSQSSAEATVDESFEFVREARLALKIYHRDEVESQGSRVEEARSKLEDLLSGLQASN